jgi:hypothetical protein
MDEYRRNIGRLRSLLLPTQLSELDLCSIITTTLPIEARHILVWFQPLTQFTEISHFPFLHGAPRQSHYTTLVFPVHNPRSALQWDALVVFRYDTHHSRSALRFHYFSTSDHSDHHLATDTIYKFWELLVPAHKFSTAAIKLSVVYHTNNASFTLLNVLSTLCESPSQSPLFTDEGIPPFEYAPILETIQTRLTSAADLTLSPEFLQHTLIDAFSSPSSHQHRRLYWDSALNAFVYVCGSEPPIFYSNPAQFHSICIFFAYYRYLPPEKSEAFPSYPDALTSAHIIQQHFLTLSRSASSSQPLEIPPLLAPDHAFLLTDSLPTWINFSDQHVLFESYSHSIPISFSVVYLLLMLYKDYDASESLLYRLFSPVAHPDDTQWPNFASFSSMEHRICCTIAHDNSLFFTLLFDLSSAFTSLLENTPSASSSSSSPPPPATNIIPNARNAIQSIAYIQLLEDFGI